MCKLVHRHFLYIMIILRSTDIGEGTKLCYNEILHVLHQLILLILANACQTILPSYQNSFFIHVRLTSRVNN